MKRFAIAALVLAGCQHMGVMGWYHPKATPEQMNKDQLECEYDARKSTANIRSGIQAGYEQSDLQHLCMRTRGYEWRRVKP